MSEDVELDLTDWASDIVYSIVRRGGPHGPGSSRFTKQRDDSFSMLLPDDVDRESAELEKENWDYQNNRKSGRYAITFEKDYEGGPALWIKASEFRKSGNRSTVVIVQRFKKRLLGRSSPIGAPILIEEH